MPYSSGDLVGALRPEEPLYSNGDSEYGVPLTSRIGESAEMRAQELHADIFEYILRREWEEVTGFSLYNVEDFENFAYNVIYPIVGPDRWKELETEVERLFVSSLGALGESPFETVESPGREIPYREMEPYLGAIGGAQYADVLREM